VSTENSEINSKTVSTRNDKDDDNPCVDDNDGDNGHDNALFMLSMLIMMIRTAVIIVIRTSADLGGCKGQSGFCRKACHYAKYKGDNITQVAVMMTKQDKLHSSMTCNVCFYISRLGCNDSFLHCQCVALFLDEQSHIKQKALLLAYLLLF